MFIKTIQQHVITYELLFEIKMQHNYAQDISWQLKHTFLNGLLKHKNL